MAGIKIYSNDKNDLIWIGIFYVLANGWIFLVANAVYWDDWSFYKIDSEVYGDLFKQAGSLWGLTANVHLYLLKIGNYIYRLLTFILMYLIGVMLFYITKKINIIDRSERFLIVLIYLILPFYSARAMLNIFPYTLSCFIFFLAWLLIKKVRIVSLILFFISFNTNSLLVFYAVPIIFLYYQEGFKKNIKDVCRFLINKIDFILLPFIFYIVKSYIGKPYGIYVGYNEGFSAVSTIKGAIFQLYNFFQFNISFGGCVVLTIFAYILFSHRKNQIIFKKNNYKYFISIGLVIFILGVFPYWIIGKTPTFIEWSTRHQLLMPLGTSVLLLGILKSKKIFYGLGPISLLAGICISYNISTYIDLYVDWKKQEQIIEYIRNSKEIEPGSLIVFDDTSLKKNFSNRTFRFYEWNGILSYAKNDQTRFGINKNQIKNYINGDMDQYINKYFASSDFDKTKLNSTILVEISEQKSELFKKKILDFLTVNIIFDVKKINLNEYN